MSLYPTVLQTQPAFSIDAIQKSNSAYYFIPTDGSGGGGGSTSNLVSPVTVVCPSGALVQQNGITVQCDVTNSQIYGYYVNDITSQGSLVQLFGQGDVGNLILGDSGGANQSYIVSGQGGTAIGNRNEVAGVNTNMILWNPTDPALTLKLKNPTVITGPSGDGVPYDTIYNPLPPPATPPVPNITSPTAPIGITSWNNTLAVGTNTPYTVPATGLYLVTTAVTISVGVGYSFPIGSVLNLTPKVQGTDDPFISHTYFLSTTGPQGNITTTQQGLGFYTAGAIIIGQLNQASTGIINLGPSGGCQLLIQQVINQYP